MNTNDIIVYDLGDVTIDRYTVFPYLTSKDNAEQCNYLGLSEGGRGFSMWGEVDCVKDLSHLGEKVDFNSLSEETQKHIIMRLKDE